MKKYIAGLLAVGLFALGVYSTHNLLADAQGGNTASASVDSEKGVTLNTKYAPDATQRAVLRTNVGVDTDDRTLTNTLTFSGSSGIVIGGTGAGLVLTAVPTSPVTGNLVVTATSFKVYLTNSTGLIVKSGTVTTF